MLFTGVHEIDMKILNELEDVDLVKICQMNRAADDICIDPYFWKTRILTKFPYLTLDIINKYKGDRSWSEYYIDDLIKINENNAQFMLTQSINNGRLDHTMIAINKGARAIPGSEVNIASLNGYLDIVKYLVEHGADPDLGDDETPVVLASSEGHLPIVKYLVEHGVDIHAGDDAALKFAIYKNYLPVVKYLVSAGANVNATAVGEAIRWAQQRGNRDVVEYLISQGAVLN